MITLGADSRYFYTPNFLVALAVVIALMHGNSQPRASRVTAIIVLAWVLGVGCIEFFHYPAYFYSGPPWREEVAAWRKVPRKTVANKPMDGLGYAGQLEYFTRRPDVDFRGSVARSEKAHDFDREHLGGEAGRATISAEGRCPH